MDIRIKTRMQFFAALALGAFSFSAFSMTSDFDGLYVGAGTGIQLSKVELMSTIQLIIPGVQSNVVNSNPNINAPSWFGGVFLGYSHVFNHSYYLALEGRVAFEDVDATNDIIFNETGSAFLLSRCEKASLNNDFTLAIKPGYLLSSGTLLYGVLGASLAKVSLSTTATFSQNPGFQLSAATSTSDNGYHVGFVAGVGLERFLTQHLSAKLEYDFVDYGRVVTNKSASTVVTGAPNPGSSFTATTNFLDVQLNKVMFGLTYHFA